MTFNRMLGLCMIFLVFLPTVLGVGVAPAKTNLDYEAGLEVSKSFSIVNSQKKDVDVFIYAKGALAEYVEFEKDIYSISSSQGEIRIPFKLKLPQSMNEPGPQNTKIYIIEIPKASSAQVIGDEVVFAGRAQISATQGVTHDLNVMVPYPGRYAQGKLFISNEGPGKPIQFSVGVFNLGSEEIEVTARVKLFGATYEELGEVKADVIKLGPGKEGKVHASYTGELNSGVYKATAFLDYGDGITTVEELFNLGDKLVVIKGMTVNDFKLGAIGKLDVTVENKWNEPLDVVGDFTVYQEGQTVSKTASATVAVPALSEGTITGYWDTNGLSIGEYDINVRANYDDKSSERLFPTYVGNDEIVIKDQLTARASNIGGGGSQLTLLIYLVLTLVVLNGIGLAIYFLKIKKRGGNK